MGFVFPFLSGFITLSFTICELSVLNIIISESVTGNASSPIYRKNSNLPTPMKSP